MEEGRAGLAGLRDLEEVPGSSSRAGGEDTDQIGPGQLVKADLLESILESLGRVPQGVLHALALLSLRPHAMLRLSNTMLRLLAFFPRHPQRRLQRLQAARRSK